MERMLKCGVELEVATSKGAYEVVKALRANGINAFETYYGSAVESARWKVHSDGSLNRGWEIVSPPMNNLDELQQVVYTLRKVVKAKASKCCGFHVHHDISDFNVNQIKNLYRLYSKYEDVIATVLHPNRKNNGYCCSIKYDVERIEELEDIHEFRYAIPSRYKTLNSRSFVKYGTIEFRQHQGTTQWEDILAWVTVTHKFVETAANATEIREKTICTTKEGQLMEMFHELGLSGNDFIMNHYFKAQRKYDKAQ